MKVSIFGAARICMFSLVFIQTAGAALVSQLGGKMVFDSDRSFAWLADANLAKTNAFGVNGIQADGRMDWLTANKWIHALNTFNGGAGYLGFTDWRLPRTQVPDNKCTINAGGALSGNSRGLNCTGSEMGHLFYDELGATQLTSVLDSGDPDLAKFSNIQIANPYWSIEEVANRNRAWTFDFSDGVQATSLKENSFKYAWAVHLPIPAAIWLFGSGLLGLFGVARVRTI
ncbi:MAG TPA: hypothetical protein ENK49_04570 [Gammaproteobacteria bacterium]|nr:hypothetical protein [Gammaproteobacteria bacterium]